MALANAQRHLPDGYVVRVMRDDDHAAISAICAAVYPTERPYTEDELRAHHALFADGQFVVEHVPTRSVAGAHFTLLVHMMHFHIDDSWDALTAEGTDVIEADWIENETTLDAEMDRYMHLRQRARDVFELKYAGTINPDANRWELCSKVLSRQDVSERLSRSW